MKNQGIILGLLAACCFAIMNVIVKIKATTLDPALVTFARGAVGTLVFLPSAKKEVLHLVKKSGLLLWCRFLAGSFSIFAMFYNVQLSGAAAGTALAKTEAIFVIILSIVVCKTFPNHTEWGGIGLILFGVYVLYAPMIVHMECSFLLVGIAGAFVGGIALIALKKVSSLFSPFFIVWGLCLGSLIVALAVPSSKPWEIAHPMDFLILCILGGLGGVGQLFLTKSYSLLSAPLASMINLSSIVWCIFFESLVLQTLPDTGSMIGYGLMIVGLIYLQVLTFYGEKRSSAKIE